MRIGFIGAGRVGYSLSKYLNDSFKNVKGIYSKNIENAIDCANFSVSEYYKDLKTLVFDCDTLFLTVNDDALISVVEELKKLNIKDKILIHTSGCQSSSIFDSLKDKNRCMSLHPIYAFSSKYKSYEGIKDIYFTHEGDDALEIEALFPKRIISINADDKIKYHAACVMISNLICGITYEAEKIFKEIGFQSIEPFIPLLEDNIKNISKYGPVKALTGPVVRNDSKTVLKHIEALNGRDLEIYKQISRVLVEMSLINHHDDYSIMKNILEDSNDNS